MKSAPEKILYATFDCLPSLSGRAMRSLQFLEALRGDFECHCVCLQDEGQPLVEEIDGIHFRRVLTEGLVLSECIEAYAQTVCSEVDRLSPRIVQVTDPFSAGLLCELRGSAGFKLIYEATGLPSFEFEAILPHWSDEFSGAQEVSLRQALRRQERFCAQKVDAVLVGSATTAKLLCDWGVDQDAIALLPTAAGDVRLPSAVRARVPGMPLELFFEGTFAPWQGLFTLLEGLALASAQLPMHLTMMGTARPRTFMESLRQHIEALAIEPAVTLIEPLTRRALADRLSDIDIGIVPLAACARNLEQGAPLAKVATYLSAGLPIVASDLPMTRELIDESCAVFFEPGNAESLADRLLYLAHAPERRAALGLTGRQLAEESLSILRTKGVLKMLYDDLLQAAQAPSGHIQIRQIRPFDVSPASAWLMEGGAPAAIAPEVEEIDPEGLELEAQDGDIEEIEEAAIEEIAPDDPHPAGSSALRASADQVAAAIPEHAAFAVCESAPEAMPEAASSPEALEDADDLLEEAIESVASAKAAGEMDDGGERALTSAFSGEGEGSPEAEAFVADVDELLEQAIEAHGEGVQPLPCPPQDASPSALPLSSRIAQEIRDCLSGARSTSPDSGLSPADEWLGHALLGYAPFSVAISDKGRSASVKFSPVPRSH